jgi:hypothetical protein
MKGDKSMLRILMLAIIALLAATAARAEPVVITMYVNPQCGCCEGHAKYLREHGFKVTTIVAANMSLIKRQHGVPENLEGCHTMLIGGYVVEGHVPAYHQQASHRTPEHQGRFPARHARGLAWNDRQQDRVVHDL